MDSSHKMNNKYYAHTGKKKRRGFLTQIELHAMLLPAVLFVVIFCYVPMYGIIIAFKNFKVGAGIWGSSWASNYGLEHFKDFFINTPNAWQIIGNTIYIALLKLVILTPPPVILAILINELKNKRFKRITQTISYLPHFVSWVVIGGILYSLLGSNGLVNQMLISLGVLTQPILWLGQKALFKPLLIITELWKEIGWSSILYLGVIVTIDPNLYEAVEIDGGGRWSKIRFVTWPFLKGTFMILFILACGSIMSGMGSTFNQVYILGNNMVKEEAQIIDTYVLRVGIENARYSFATAVGLFKSVINVILLITANRLSNYITGKSLF